MKASELITELERIVDNYGDGNVVITDGEDGSTQSVTGASFDLDYDEINLYF